jgi:hypothetical protein
MLSPVVDFDAPAIGVAADAAATVAGSSGNDNVHYASFLRLLCNNLFPCALWN